MKRRTKRSRRCAICDEVYDPGGERAVIHEHPEPQSGSPRDAWLRSGLTYEKWIETADGKDWLDYKEILLHGII